ncbi:MAG TPA: alpha/beta fold hydrolase [Sumerlaeia bacterium]|nr:alpha/beta fold hydrolase [Sumerlaeia bacterium]
MKRNIPQSLYPFESRYLEIAGLRCHYLDEGAGEPVVMLHGNPTWSFMYRNLVVALRDKRRAIVPDHIGCGLSDKPDDSRYDYVLARRVDDLETLLDRLGVGENVTLVLHDWGGAIGMAWAARHPGAVKRLVIFNTAAFHKPDATRFPLALRLCRMPLLAPLLVRGLNAFSFGASRVCVKRKPMPSEVRRAYRAPYDSWANRIATLRFVQDIPLRPGDRSYDLIAEAQASLEKFRDAPTLICWGLRDSVFDRHFLVEWLRYLPDAEVHRFEDAGHYVLEDAGDEIIPLVQAFLERHPL